MNRATKWYLSFLENETYSRYAFHIASTDYYSDAVKKSSKAQKRLDKKNNRNRLFNPIDVIKFMIRTERNFKFGPDGAVTLGDLKKEDKYETVKTWFFGTRFTYCKDQGGYIPLGYELEKSRWLTQQYKAGELDRMNKCWKEAKKYLSNPDGSDPILIHSSDDSHLYFMQNKKTKHIKIGISIHPEVRKKQISAQEQADIKILHIVSSAGRKKEKELHMKYKKYNVRGEWFKPSKVILDYIKSLKEEPIKKVT